MFTIQYSDGFWDFVLFAFQGTTVKHVVALIATDGILPVSLRIKGVDCVNREEDSSNLPKHHISVL